MPESFWNGEIRHKRCGEGMLAGYERIAGIVSLLQVSIKGLEGLGGILGALACARGNRLMGACRVLRE